MANHDVETVAGAEVFRQLLGEIDGTMLAPGATERDLQVLEAAAVIIAQARIHKRRDASQELTDALLVTEIFDDGHVFAGERLVALFAPGIGQTSRVEDEAAAVAGLGRCEYPVKGEAENSHSEILGLGDRFRVQRQSLQFL